MDFFFNRPKTVLFFISAVFKTFISCSFTVPKPSILHRVVRFRLCLFTKHPENVRHWMVQIRELRTFSNRPLDIRCTYAKWLKRGGFKLHKFASKSHLLVPGNQLQQINNLRVQDSAGKYSSQLLCSKKRIAPLKVLTTPWLELSGALL